MSLAESLNTLESLKIQLRSFIKSPCCCQTNSINIGKLRDINSTLTPSDVANVMSYTGGSCLRCQSIATLVPQMKACQKQTSELIDSIYGKKNPFLL